MVAETETPLARAERLVQENEAWLAEHKLFLAGLQQAGFARHTFEAGQALLESAKRRLEQAREELERERTKAGPPP